MFAYLGGAFVLAGLSNIIVEMQPRPALGIAAESLADGAIELSSIFVCLGISKIIQAQRKRSSF
jgi:hypothetical protein